MISTLFHRPSPWHRLSLQFSLDSFDRSELTVHIIRDSFPLLWCPILVADKRTRRYWVGEPPRTPTTIKFDLMISSSYWLRVCLSKLIIRRFKESTQCLP